MKDYPAERIRNLALIGHGGTGKTSLAEAMLFTTDTVTHLGRVEDGTTTSDWDAEEIKRKGSVNLSLLPFERAGHKLNIVDTPGYADFVGEVKCGLRAADAALIVVCAAAGVQVGTEYAWLYAEEINLPRAFFINRIDRENADFFSVVDQIQVFWGQKCVPLEIPIGTQSEFQGVVDLVEMKAYGDEKDEPMEVPEELTEEAASWRQKLVEAAAETNDALITKYLGGEELSPEEVADGLRRGIAGGTLVPVLVGSATRVTGVRRLLDSLVNLFPSPADTAMETEEETTLMAEPSGPLAALVFKTTADPYVGRLTYFRVLSGTLESDSHVWNANKRAQERIGPLYQVLGKGQEQAAQVTAGDIGAVAKLATTTTGDTLGEKEQTLTLAPISFPQPALSSAVHPKTKADLDKMGSALPRIVEEDPSLQLGRSPDTSETILSGLGDSHLEVALEKIRRKFGVDLELTLPKVPYKETVTASSQSEYTHKKQSGGHGQYAKVTIMVEPLPRGSGFEFVNQIKGGAVPRNYIPSVEKGVVEAMQEGVIAHHPLTDVRVTLVDGKEHPVDSSDMAFKIAGSMALKKGAQDAQPALLEPLVTMKITVPEANTGDVISDLNGKRSRVLGMTPEGSLTTIEAQAPLAEVQRYAADLRSITQGRGRYTLAPGRYEEVPQHVTKRMMEAQKE